MLFRSVLISQTPGDAVIAMGRAAAARLGLEFEHRHVGLQPFTDSIVDPMRNAIAVSISGRVS